MNDLEIGISIEVIEFKIDLLKVKLNTNIFQ